MIITGKPDIRFWKSHYDVRIGRSVMIKCCIGTTRPHVTEVWWTKGNEVRVYTDRRPAEEISRPNYRTSLNLHKVNKTDEGEYQCHARNRMGEEFAKITVTIGSMSIKDLSMKKNETIRLKKLTAQIITKQPPPPPQKKKKKKATTQHIRH